MRPSAFKIPVTLSNAPEVVVSLNDPPVLFPDNKLFKSISEPTELHIEAILSSPAFGIKGKTHIATETESIIQSSSKSSKGFDGPAVQHTSCPAIKEPGDPVTAAALLLFSISNSHVKILPSHSIVPPWLRTLVATFITPELHKYPSL